MFGKENITIKFYENTFIYNTIHNTFIIIYKDVHMFLWRPELIGLSKERK